VALNVIFRGNDGYISIVTDGNLSDDILDCINVNKR